MIRIMVMANPMRGSPMIRNAVALAIIQQPFCISSHGSIFLVMVLG